MSWEYKPDGDSEYDKPTKESVLSFLFVLSFLVIMIVGILVVWSTQGFGWALAYYLLCCVVWAVWGKDA